MTYTLNKKVLAPLFILGSLMVAIVIVVPHSFAATKSTTSVNVIGKAKFVLQGTITTVTTDSLILRVTNTSKNAKLFDGKDITVKASSKTTITKNAKNISLRQIKSGDKIKVFGIFDKKSGAITLVRWIKVVAQ